MQRIANQLRNVTQSIDDRRAASQDPSPEQWHDDAVIGALLMARNRSNGQPRCRQSHVAGPVASAIRT